VRDGAYAHVALALDQLARGDAAAAETTLREIISVGFLMTENSATLIENLIGIVIIGVGGDALHAFYQSTGRTRDAEDLAWARESARLAAERMRAGIPQPPDGSLAQLRGLPAIVLDSTAIRGLRWEFFMMLNTLGPCINLNRAVFGPGQEYATWVERARAGLVQYESEAWLFERASRGFFGDAMPQEVGLFPRMLAASMGGRDGPGSCAASIGLLNAVQ
jgi:hypothetical protein